MKKFIIMTIILIVALSCFIGCSDLKERKETRIVKEVISFVEERQKSDGISAENASFRASDEDEAYYSEQSFREQANALFYCKMAVYIYESQPSLTNDTMYAANNIGEEQGELHIRLTNAGGVLTMEANYNVKDKSTFVYLKVNYDEETEKFNSYSVSERNSFDDKTVYFESLYEMQPDGKELLYSAQYEQTDYYIFEYAADNTILATNEDKEEIITTIYGKKSIQEHLTEISERANVLLQEMTTAEPEIFTFNYDGLMEYLSGPNYGHKGNSSSGENENTEFKIVCYCENGRVLEDTAIAYQGKWTISPSFPKVGDAITDDSGKDWIIEGFYWDEEYTQPITVFEELDYSGQKEIKIYAKMSLAEDYGKT